MCEEVLEMKTPEELRGEIQGSKERSQARLAAVGKMVEDLAYAKTCIEGEIERVVNVRKQ